MTDLNALFVSLTRSYLEEVPQKLTTLRYLVDTAATDEAALNMLAERAHQLAGSAGTFKLPELGERARDLLNQVRPLAAAHRTITHDEHSLLRALVDVMEAATPQHLH